MFSNVLDHIIRMCTLFQWSEHLFFALWLPEAFVLKLHLTLLQTLYLLLRLFLSDAFFFFLNYGIVPKISGFRLYMEIVDWFLWHLQGLFQSHWYIDLVFRIGLQVLTTLFCSLWKPFGVLPFKVSLACLRKFLGFFLHTWILSAHIIMHLTSSAVMNIISCCMTRLVLFFWKKFTGISP